MHARGACQEFCCVVTGTLSQFVAMKVEEIIAALGGRLAVADLTGAKPNAVTQWRAAGIPFKYWHVLVEHAKAASVESVTYSALEQARSICSERACSKQAA